METLLSRLNTLAGLHVIQRAATPARKPRPIAVNVIARAIVPARVKKMMAPASTGFRFVSFLFCARPALFVRLTARFFVSHNYISWSICFLLRPPTHPRGGEPSFLANRKPTGKQFVRPALAFPSLCRDGDFPKLDKIVKSVIWSPR